MKSVSWQLLVFSVNMWIQMWYMTNHFTFDPRRNMPTTRLRKSSGKTLRMAKWMPWICNMHSTRYLPKVGDEVHFIRCTPGFVTESKLSFWWNVITGCTGSCQFDNFRCSHWWQFHQNDRIPYSVVWFCCGHIITFASWIRVVMQIFRVASLALGQSYDCIGASEVIL